MSLVIARVIPLRLMIPNILAQCCGAAAASYAASRLRGYPTGAIPIAPDGDIWTIFTVECRDTIPSKVCRRSETKLVKPEVYPKK